MKVIEEEHYSKYLLVDERKDEIIGVVSVKDIILMVGNQQKFNLCEIARPLSLFRKVCMQIKF